MQETHNLRRARPADGSPRGRLLKLKRNYEFGRDGCAHARMRPRWRGRMRAGGGGSTLEGYGPPKGAASSAGVRSCAIGLSVCMSGALRQAFRAAPKRRPGGTRAATDHGLSGALSGRPMSVVSLLSRNPRVAGGGCGVGPLEAKRPKNLPISKSPHEPSVRAREGPGPRTRRRGCARRPQRPARPFVAETCNACWKMLHYAAPAQYDDVDPDGKDARAQRRARARECRRASCATA